MNRIRTGAFLILVSGLFVSVFAWGCHKPKDEEGDLLFSRRKAAEKPNIQYIHPWMDSLDTSLLELCARRPANGFDLPVAPPDGKDYYKYRSLIPGEHYGEDWNHIAGGNRDYGHLVYSIADGVVIYADTATEPGWGMVVRILYNTGTVKDPKYVEALYAHLASIWVKVGNFMRRGEPVGTIGTADGIYHAHLHFELRDVPGMPLHPKLGADSTHFLDPTGFIELHRPPGYEPPVFEADTAAGDS